MNSDVLRLAPGDELKVENPNFKDLNDEGKLKRDIDNGYRVKHVHRLKVEGKAP